ncbi:ABC transporter permease, partial [Pseudomonas syringae]|nr:ABC transporter permease [Pseudomonas syringae]
MTSQEKSLPAVPQTTSTERQARNLWQRSGTRLKGLVVPALVIVLLEVIVRIGWLPSYQMPAPSEILLTLRDLADGALWKHISASLLRVLSGFLIGASLALVFAAWVGLSREAEAYLEPTFAGLRSIPSLAWVPLLLLWLGIGETSKIVLIAIGAFFPVYLNGV